MKICNACGAYHEGSWLCPSCGYKPRSEDGYISFVDRSHDSPGSFNPDFFSVLSDLEEGSFWFRARNRIVTWALLRYFSNAATMLEIGCGTGFVLSGINREIPGLNLTGSDIFAESIAFAKKRVPSAVFLQMDAMNIPFADEFDIIGAFDILEHMDNDRQAFREMYKAVGRGGGIVLTVPQHPWLWSIHDEAACHVRRYTSEELNGKVAEAGFRIVFTTSFMSLLLPLMLASRIGSIIRRRDPRSFDCTKELKIPAVLDILFEKICIAEHFIMKKGMRFPFGGSLLCIAMKD